MEEGGFGNGEEVKEPLEENAELPMALVGNEEESVDFLEESVVLPMEKTKKFTTTFATKDLFCQIVKATLGALSIQIDNDLLVNLTEDRARQIEDMIVDAIQDLKNSQANALIENSLSSWIEYAEEHPLATNDISSPVIMNVLSTWTKNLTKRNFFVHWVKSLSSPYDQQAGLPLGIQITGISKVLRDAFLVLVLPVLRHVSIDDILTTTREYPGNPGDEIVLSTMHYIPPKINEESTEDPFVERSETIYDVRFKRLANHENISTRHNSDDYVCSSQPHFCLESDDYSPLSEINTGLKDLEKKAREEMEAYDRERIAKLRAEQRSCDSRNSNASLYSPNTSAGTTAAGGTWIDQISSWFVPASGVTSSAASAASSTTGRWSSFSVVPTSFSLVEEDDGYDVNRRSSSFSVLPLEAQAHLAMSESSATSWWGSAPAKANSSAPKGGKRVSFEESPRNTQDAQSNTSSVASSPEYLPGPLEEFEIFQKTRSNQQSALSSQPQNVAPLSPSNVGPPVEISRESAAERAAKNKDKIAARLAALREKQLSGK